MTSLSNVKQDVTDTKNTCISDINSAESTALTNLSAKETEVNTAIENAKTVISKYASINSSIVYVETIDNYNKLYDNQGVEQTLTINGVSVIKMTYDSNIIYLTND